MITVRQIERLWEARDYAKLFEWLLASRPEGTLRLGIDTGRAVPAAAVAIIRLDELSQSHAKLYSKLLKTILGAQQADGGWGDLITTALCLRALLCGQGNGVAINRGMTYLTDLQKTEGIWPNVPIRRMPADPYVSALILYQLADQPSFRAAVRLMDAINWFPLHEHSIDQQTRALWERVRIRCRVPTRPSLAQSLS